MSEILHLYYPGAQLARWGGLVAGSQAGKPVGALGLLQSPRQHDARLSAHHWVVNSSIFARGVADAQTA